MGTRGLTKVIKNGETVVAQYGQWDHYPAGQGATVFYRVSNPDTMQALEDNLNLIFYPSDEEREAMAKPFEDGSIPGMMTFDSGKAFAEKYPSLTRDTGAEIIDVIAEATEPVPLYLDEEFEDDKLFCEGVYTINLDNKTFSSKWDKTVTLTFDEVRSMTIRDYLAKFDYDEEYLDNVVDSINKHNQPA